MGTRTTALCGHKLDDRNPHRHSLHRKHRRSFFPPFFKDNFSVCPDMSSTPTPLLKCFRAGRHNIVKISVIEATTFRSYATLSYVSLSTISLNIAHKSLLLWGFVVAMHIHMNGIFWENMLVEWQKQRMYGIRRRFIQQPISHLLISFPLMLEATF